MPLLIPDLIYRDGRFEAGLGLEYDAGTGRITRVGPAGALAAGVAGAAGAAGGGANGTDTADGADAAGGAAARAGARPEVERLPGRALLPGFVNAHSHAFQRLIRGRTQWRPATRPHADFWSWREAMYAAALAMSPEDVFLVSRFCFLEMLRAGITSVGEFHYLHRDPEGRRYQESNELAHRVLEAAADVGLRIALLNVCYATGAIGGPLRPEQRRFATPELDAYLRDTADLQDRFRGDPRVTVGVAPHSVRAVPREWLRELRAWAASRDVAVHMHVSEQPREVEDCVAAYGLRPVELLAAEGVLDERFTAVHATHLSPEEVALLGDAGATVCACPTTERDLGDGFLPGAELLDAAAPIALGSDSHTVIDPFEEMRLVEYHERLRRLRRVVLAVPGADGRLEVAPLLLELATESGARSLRLDAGRLEAGRLADFIAIDLDHPTLAGWTPETLPAILTLSAPPDVVTDVWVGGVRRLDSRRHPLDAEAAAAFREVAARVV
ncbi:MAG TPA: formimidoylglutamate deiminase [Longimicrobiales bacterium]